MQQCRLDSGGLIDRNSSIDFSFNGRNLKGYAGDSLASALLANNIHLVARSIKYHRPRGIVSAGLEEPSALVACRTGGQPFRPNLKVTEVELSDGLEVKSQNCWPTVSFDAAAILQGSAPLLRAGFYYKTFKWPKTWWHDVYEKIIRRLAGQGKVDPGVDLHLYDRRQHHCDLLIIGAGPTGLSAALSHIESDLSVTLIEQDRLLGGSSLWDKFEIDSMPVEEWRRQAIDKISSAGNIKIMTNTLAFGQYDHGLVMAIENQTCSWRIRASQIILATGACEHPLLFPDNDRPGIMLAASVRKYIHRYAVAPGNNAFVAVLNDKERRQTEQTLEMAGINIVHSLQAGETIVATYGRRRLNRVAIIDSSGKHRQFDCDLLCMSSGWKSNNHLADQLNNTPVSSTTPQTALNLNDRVFVDLQNDVTCSDLELAVQEGYDNIELLKRYTTTGMGTDQGKTSWPNAIQQLSQITGQSFDSIGQTTVRPPYSPVSIGAIVGAETDQHMTPARHTPFHRVFSEAGCVFQTSGDWIYSRYFPGKGESMQQSVRREVLAVRNAVGCVDMSTLGKVDVKGSDALEFLSRLYCNKIDSLEPGRLRYALMLREDGILFDDGTIAQLGDNHFLVTMTTANAGSVWRWMNQWRQLHWPELDVQLTLVSGHWASLAIAGPKARCLLQDLSPDFAVDRDSFPFAAVRQGYLDYIPCRVFSVSFSGELSYEINVPARYATHLFRQVMQAGKAYEVAPYGLEALDILRIEKGHVSIGTEIDGRTTANDLGLGRMVSTSKAFVGSSLLKRPALQESSRLQLVGLSPVDGHSEIPAAAHLTDKPWQSGKAQTSQGRLTASIFSPTLNQPVALALLKNGQQRHGEKIWAVSPIEKKSQQVVVGPTCFVDPQGERLHE